MKKFLLAAQTLLLLFAAAPNAQAQKSYDLKKFPKGCRPEEIYNPQNEMLGRL